MSLQAGHKLAHYEILEPIGKGGMGEVYRAKDGKLGRDVAIKVLPDEFAQDEERLRRFQREAKVLASLNHPNIAAIYGLEQSGDTHYLVLELVPGETLAERIARGSIPVEEALEIATKIAEALEEAHEQGIVHRDLKPANVKQTEDGKIKVLDFGLAKAFLDDCVEGDASTSMSPTLTRDATRVGVILGTAAYMSPEQAKGKGVDRRTDIWAFGVVLYEMLTGKRAFAGEDVSDTLAYVLTKEPDWEALPPETPASFRQVLRLCITKDVKQRARDIGDVRLAMGGAFQITALEPVPATPGWRHMLPWVLAALAVGSVITGFVLLRAMHPPPPVARLQIALPEDHLVTNADRRGVAISPAGTHVVYVANRQLYLRAMAESEITPIRGTENSVPTLPFFSPDGQWIGFYALQDRELKKISLTGGAAVTICAVENTEDATWHDDDSILFAERSQGIFRVPAAGGEPQLVIAPDDAAFLAHRPQMLPGREWILFTLYSVAFGTEPRIVAQSSRSGERKVLVAGGTDGRYLETGHLLYAIDGVLFAAPFDPDQLEVTGGAVPLVEGIETTNPGMSFDVSRTGSLVYNPARGQGGRRMVWVDREGQQVPLWDEARAFGHPRISPDGTRVAVNIFGDDPDVWLFDLERETLARLTTDPAGDFSPTWTPDGARIVFNSERKDRVTNLYWKSADGTGGVEQLTNIGESRNALDFTPDQALLLFHAGPITGGDLRVLSMDGEQKDEPLLVTEFNERNADLSSDGRFMVYQSNVSGRHEIYVRPFPNVNDRLWPISTGGGRDPVWGPDDTELFYRTNDGGQMWRVSVRTSPSFSIGDSEVLFEGNYNVNPFTRSYDIAPDGRRFLMLTGDAVSTRTELHVVLNWFEELKARVPTDD